MKGHQRRVIIIILVFICLCPVYRSNVLAAVPPEAEKHNQKGNDFCTKGEFEKAVEEYKKALEIYPQFADAIYNLGVTYFNDLKDYEQAAKYFTEFLQQEGNSQDAKQVKSILDIIEKEHNIIYTPQREEELKTKIVEEKENENIIKEKPTEKEEIIIKALEYKNEGNRFTKEGEYELAIKQYKKALEIYPNYLDALYNIAKVYYFELGNIEDAIKYWEKFLEHEPSESSDAKLVKTWLREAKMSLNEIAEKKEEDKQLIPDKKDIAHLEEKEEKDTEAELKMKRKERDLKLAGVNYESRPFSKGPISQMTLIEQKDQEKLIDREKENRIIEKDIIEEEDLKKTIENIQPKQEIVLTTYLPKEKRTRNIYSMVRDEIEKELILIFTQKNARDPRKLADIFKTKTQRDILPNGDEISILKLPSNLLANLERVYILTAEDRRKLEKEKWDLIRSRQSPERLKELLNFIREGYIIK